MYKSLDKILIHLRPYGNKTIWKYMPLQYFTEMIKNKVLYLPRADINPKYFEGRFIKEDEKLLIELFKIQGDPDPINKTKKALTFFLNHKRCTYFDSWTLNDYECFAMWKIYGKNKNAIAIKSKIHNLIKVYDNKKESDCIIAKIEYYRPTERIKTYNNKLLFLRKPISFCYEREIRGLIQFPYFSNSKYPKNQEIPIVTFSDLIDEIVLSPYSSKNFSDQMHKILLKSRLEKIAVNNSIYKTN